MAFFFAFLPRVSFHRKLLFNIKKHNFFSLSLHSFEFSIWRIIRSENRPQLFISFTWFECTACTLYSTSQRNFIESATNWKCNDNESDHNFIFICKCNEYFLCVFLLILCQAKLETEWGARHQQNERQMLKWWIRYDQLLLCSHQFSRGR